MALIRNGFTARYRGRRVNGFAVVADEIRKLAESSSEQSKTISNVLKKIKEVSRFKVE